MTVAAKTAELEEYLQEAITEGADLDAIEAMIAAFVQAQGDETAPPPADDFGRPILDMSPDGTPPPAGQRHYFNIRDKAEGDPNRAADLAAWAIRRYRAAQDTIGSVNKAAARQIAMIEAWRKDQAKHAEAEASFFEGVLDQYHSDFANGETKVALPGGTLKLQKNRRTISWDEAAAKDWALQQIGRVDDYCPRGFSKSAVKADLAKRDDGTYTLTETGEIVEFVRDVEPAVPFTFKVELT